MNRLDAVIRFASLDRDSIVKIVDLELAKVARALAEQRIALSWTPEATAKLAEAGYDPVFGARPVKRVIQREVQDRLADAILAAEVSPGGKAVLDVDVDGDGFAVRG